ncbi:MAG: cyclic nucleotide-binding domain-containing protein [Candidatus Saganbacteria bacterium]|nr:cyclic nucleotide-binding domain-containing protein [Candidatus Saganbacteria bacterium]
MFENIALKAFAFGIFSAVSLPLGAITARFWNPGNRIVAAMMAFGAGALLSALTLDLVGEAVHKGQFYPLAFGCILGGLLFIALNRLVNSKGGFLRKSSTTIAYLRRKKLKEYKKIFKKLSCVPLFNHLPPGEIKSLLPYVSSRTYQAGSTMIRQGELGDSLFIIASGEVDILDEKNNSKKIATLGKDDILGEMALVTNELRSATALAKKDTKVWLVLKEDFNKVIQTSPELAKEVKSLVLKRIADLKSKDVIHCEMADKWFDRAVRHIDDEVLAPTSAEIKEAATHQHGAPMAIWLGILLDGIPESFVIGSSILHGSVSLSLLAGLFLSNYPEALSSSIGMQEQRYPFKKILLMWTSLMVITGFGALLGNIFFVNAPHFLFALVQGIAAGAMLTMIAETMLPEAFNRGGPITGFSTLMGFLVAVFFKTIG